MKVLIIQPWIRLGGSEMVSVNFAYKLQLHGHEAAIVCTFLDLTGMPDQAKAVKYILPPQWLSRWVEKSRILFLLLSPWILLALVWRNSQTVDILNPHEFPSTWVAVLVGSLRRIPIVWCSYGPTRRFGVRDVFNVGLSDWLGWTFASSFIDRILVRRLSAIHVPSEKSRKSNHKRYSCESKVIPLGVDHQFYGAGNANRVLKEFNLDDKFILLCVGKLHPQENQVVCLEAIRSVLLDIPNAFLVIAGDGPMLKRLEQIVEDLKIKNHVMFVGHIPSWKVRDFYKACSIHLYPPLDESWGLTPIEALCAQRISIVSSECGASEVIARESIGVVCEPTSEAFARNILEIYENLASYQKMVDKGRRYVLKNLTWDYFTTSVIKIMESARSDARMTTVIKSTGESISK